MKIFCAIFAIYIWLYLIKMIITVSYDIDIKDLIKKILD